MQRSKIIVVVLALAGLGIGGCGSGQQKQDKGYFTSGNPEADQRAEQRMAKARQLSQSGSGGGEKGEAPKPETLFERLGGERGLTLIVEDFVPRAMSDPRVNWDRSGVTKGGFWPWKRNDSVAWNPSHAQVEQLKKHMIQFLSVATGGPAHYDGKEMKQAHAGLHISNAEFDAAVGDFKATLDKLGVPVKEQKEVLAIVESTRPQVAEDR